MTQTPQVLPPFTGDDTRCVKCGNTNATDYGVATSFGSVPDAERLRQHANPLQVLLNPDGEEEPQLPPILRGYEPGQEFLARTCGRCGYNWLEATLDDPNLAFRSSE